MRLTAGARLGKSGWGCAQGTLQTGRYYRQRLLARAIGASLAYCKPLDRFLKGVEVLLVRSKCRNGLSGKNWLSRLSQVLI